MSCRTCRSSASSSSRRDASCLALSSIIRDGFSCVEFSNCFSANFSCAGRMACRALYSSTGALAPSNLHIFTPSAVQQFLRFVGQKFPIGFVHQRKLFQAVRSLFLCGQPCGGGIADLICTKTGVLAPVQQLGCCLYCQQYRCDQQRCNCFLVVFHDFYKLLVFG